MYIFTFAFWKPSKVTKINWFIRFPRLLQNDLFPWIITTRPLIFDKAFPNSNTLVTVQLCQRFLTFLFVHCFRFGFQFFFHDLSCHPNERSRSFWTLRIRAYINGFIVNSFELMMKDRLWCGRTSTTETFRRGHFKYLFEFFFLTSITRTLMTCFKSHKFRTQWRAIYWYWPIPWAYSMCAGRKKPQVANDWAIWTLTHSAHMMWRTSTFSHQ